MSPVSICNPKIISHSQNHKRIDIIYNVIYKLDVNQFQGRKEKMKKNLFLVSFLLGFVFIPKVYAVECDRNIIEATGSSISLSAPASLLGTNDDLVWFAPGLHGSLQNGRTTTYSIGSSYEHTGYVSVINSNGDYTHCFVLNSNDFALVNSTKEDDIFTDIEDLIAVLAVEPANGHSIVNVNIVNGLGWIDEYTETFQSYSKEQIDALYLSPLFSTIEYPKGIGVSGNNNYTYISNDFNIGNLFNIGAHNVSLNMNVIAKSSDINITCSECNEQDKAIVQAVKGNIKSEYQFFVNEYIKDGKDFCDNGIDGMKVIGSTKTSINKDINNSSIVAMPDPRMGDCESGNVMFGGPLALLKNDVIYDAVESVAFYGAIEIPNFDKDATEEVRLSNVKNYIEAMLPNKIATVTDNGLEQVQGSEIEINTYNILLADKTGPVSFMIDKIFGIKTVHAGIKYDMKVAILSGNSLAINQPSLSGNPAVTLDNVWFFVISGLLSLTGGVILFKKLMIRKA